ncbi:MAG TPA: PqiC family protein [Nevskiaceae bacterium]
MRRFAPSCAVVAALASALALAGCASRAPIHYYTLVGAPTAASAAASPGYAIDLRPVAMPPGLRTRSMVLHTGGPRVLVQDDHQWLAPLPDEVRSAVAADLAAELGVRDVAGLPAARGRIYRVTLAVRDFDAVYGGVVSVDATWSIAPGDGGAALLVCSSRASRPVDAGYAALASGARQALAAIATQIAAGLRSLPAARCPA